MTDLTPLLDELLKSHDAKPMTSPSLTLQNIDEFQKEAYRINSHIASLNAYLKKIRQSYLSTAPPPRRTRLATNEKQWPFLTDRQREEIDAETKQLLRELNASIRHLADAEQLRQDTERTLSREKFARLGLGSLGKWAAGGAGQTKSSDQQLEEARANAISGHRESVLWYLRQKLQECGGIQASMMEKRILREVEKNKSVLANSKLHMPELGGFENAAAVPSSSYKSSAALPMETQQMDPETELSQEQVQMFEQENQDMLRLYESKLDQVRTAEKSLVEISELQTQLVNNLATQSEYISQLVEDSLLTTENVGGGNKQLKKAAERKSTANKILQYDFMNPMAPSNEHQNTANTAASPNNPAPPPPSSYKKSSSPVSRLQTISAHMSSSTSTSFSADAVPQAPEDPLFGLMAAYRADTFDKKVDLGIGAYRGDDAKPWVLPVVKKADEILRNDPALNHEYLPIAGLASFTSAAAKLILGADSPALADKRVCSLQTISGTGAVHLGALFLSKFFPVKATAYFSNPTWANHFQIFSNVQLAHSTYPYFSASTKGLDFDGMKKAIGKAPDRSIILLHACAHNPTGVDPTQEQWKELAVLIREKSHFPFFDCAYQGFASGDLAKDAWAVRYFVEQGFELCIAQSFAKNFGLYGERAGCFHFVTGPGTDSQATIGRIASQLAILQRSEISNPPAYGARIAGLVLNDEALFAEWEENLRTMSGRIISMRKALRSKLEEQGTPGTWNHITDQIGMFSYTGLSEKQVLELRSTAHVYMTKNGRISMAGLNTGNVDYFAKAVDKVVRDSL
ncbi:hypothetical protein HYALB_00001596 [Hymenoscyphus albidus]|uniref:Aspartate aminotransferase n=1 Tax=Hymenoscyphus albidus TaxID=595503 RepID=A0A9N9LED6_9HELO|nr:hypothetical protein HYALB_00001596 [Hymenoscyphus albidus]